MYLTLSEQLKVLERLPDLAMVYALILQERPMHLLIGRRMLVLLLGCSLLACEPESRTEKAAAPAHAGIAVDVQVARVGTLLPPVEVVGTTAPVRDVVVRARSDGRLEQLHVGVGDVVREGEAIARLEADLLEQALREEVAALAAARAEAASAATAVAEARLTLEQAQNEAVRSTQLAARGLISRQEAEQHTTQARTTAERLHSQQALLQAARERVVAQEALVAQAQERLSYVAITSPIAGRVLEKLTDPGNVLGVGDGIVRVGDLSQVDILASLSELDLGRVTLGRQVPVRLDAFPQTEWHGEVIRISPQADPVSRLVPVTILVPNADGMLSAGLLARVEIAAAGEPHVIIPASALALTPGGQNALAAAAPEVAPAPEASSGPGEPPGSAAVFVVQESPEGLIAEERHVRIGRRADEQVEVFEGLQAGEQVIVRSAQPLTPGSRLRLSALSQGVQTDRQQRDTTP